MSRSYRKTQKAGMTTAVSEKLFKALEHRRERRNTKMVVQTEQDGDTPRLHRSYGDPWNGPKDGKSFWRNPSAKFWRK